MSNNRNSQLEVGELIANRYRVVRLLGRGGMSVVVEAVHVQLNQRVAIKLITSPSMRCLDEARVTALLTSEHAVRVTDCGVHGDLPYLVMEQLEGCDLKTHLANVREESIPEAASMILQVCEAIGEAHGRGIVHTDLKPSNLFVSRRVDGSRCMKVLDFGIARNANGPNSNIIAGSPGYAAPEQLVPNGKVDARTDIWALGVILYRMISGELPFGGNKELDQALLAALTTTPRALPDDVPGELAEAILRCLKIDPEDRFSNVGELALALAPFVPPEDTSYVKRTWCVLSASAENPIAMDEVFPEEDWSDDEIESHSQEDDAQHSTPALVSELVPARPRSGILSVVLASAMMIGLLFLARNHLPASRVTLVRSAAAATTTQRPAAPPALPVVAVAPPPAPAPPAVLAPPAPLKTKPAALAVAAATKKPGKKR